MYIVLLTALGVGSATLIGALIGFLFKNISHRFSDIVLSFAAGIMLSASFLGLIMPSLEYGGKYAIWVSISGIFAGAIMLNFMDKLIPHLHRLAGSDSEAHKDSRINKVMLFLLAIGIHNLPEGIAAGVGFGTDNTAEAFIIAAGIALQNIPEGMVIIAPMLSVGISAKKTLLCAFATGLVEVIGTLLGYFATSVSSAVLPFALAFAGGTMLYIISDEMIPETHAHGGERASTYALLFGFCVMLCMDYFIG